MEFVEVVRELLRAYPLRAAVEGVPPGTSGGASGERCSFHLVSEGSGLLRMHPAHTLSLHTGDLVFVPNGRRHEVCAPRVTRGYLTFQGARSNPLVDALPDFVLVRAYGSVERERSEALARLMAAEARVEAPDPLVRDSVAELLFALVLRAHFETAEAKRGFIAALADPRIGRTLAAIHRAPQRPWRVETLAETAALSRTAFVEAFTERVGEPPMRYLARLRMRRAAALLRDPRNTVATVAAQLGYRSEAAFRRAYKRLAGERPGRGAARAQRSRKGGHPRSCSLGEGPA